MNCGNIWGFIMEVTSNAWFRAVCLAVMWLDSAVMGFLFAEDRRALAVFYGVMSLLCGVGAMSR